MHLFDAPPTPHELQGQPVEQFWMCRSLAHLSEVVQTTDDAAAEMSAPDAVYHDS